MLLLATPMALAVFPQQTTMPVTALEQKFQGLKNSKGNKVETVVFNKGL
jgi:hypothetical protein